MILSLQWFDTVGWATVWAYGLYKAGCWFVGSDNLTPVVTSISIILAAIKSRMETLWYRLTQVVLENGRQTVVVAVVYSG